jgi:hypothetical protein
MAFSYGPPKDELPLVTSEENCLNLSPPIIAKEPML